MGDITTSCIPLVPKDVTKSTEADDYVTWDQILSPVEGSSFRNAKLKAFLREFLSGLTVALAQVPEAVAFALTAGVDPIVGLQAAWIICLITALFGGSPGMISGATGAIAVVLPDFVEENGVGFLFIAIIMMGIIQVVLGAVGIGKLVKLIGAPVMIGFCNGLAIVILLAQFHSFKHECEANYDGPFQGCWLGGDVIAWQCMIVFVTMGTIILTPKFKWTSGFPPSLAGIIIGTASEFAIVRTAGNETPLVEDLASIKGSFPLPIWSDSQYDNIEIPSLFDSDTWSTAFPTALTLAIIGLVESLLTLQLVSELTNRKGNPLRECLAQGSANIIVGIFGGMGGCAMIGQSMINVKSGGVTRISSAVSGIFLLVILLAAYKLINIIPTASLAGVMFMVVIGTFDWDSLKLIFHSTLPSKYRNSPKINAHEKIKRTDALIIVVVTVVAVLVNLAVAVAAGVLLSTVFFSWGQTDEFSIQVMHVKEEDNDKADIPMKEKKIYRVHGPLFFGTTQTFEETFDVVNDPMNIEIHMQFAQISDYSALAAVNKVANKYKEQGKTVHLKNVKPDAMKLIKKAKHLFFAYDAEAENSDSVFEDMEIDPNFDTAFHARASGVETTPILKKRTESVSTEQSETKTGPAKNISVV